MNPYAARTIAVNGEVDVSFLRDVGPRSTRAAKDLDRWLSPSGEMRPEGAYLGGRGRAGAHDAPGPSLSPWVGKSVPPGPTPPPGPRRPPPPPDRAPRRQ